MNLRIGWCRRSRQRPVGFPHHLHRVVALFESQESDRHRVVVVPIIRRIRSEQVGRLVQVRARRRLSGVVSLQQGLGIQSPNRRRISLHVRFQHHEVAHGEVLSVRHDLSG